MIVRRRNPKGPKLSLKGKLLRAIAEILAYNEKVSFKQARNAITQISADDILWDDLESISKLQKTIKDKGYYL